MTTLREKYPINCGNVSWPIHTGIGAAGQQLAWGPHLSRKGRLELDVQLILAEHCLRRPLLWESGKRSGRHHSTHGTRSPVVPAHGFAVLHECGGFLPEAKAGGRTLPIPPPVLGLVEASRRSGSTTTSGTTQISDDLPQQD